MIEIKNYKTSNSVDIKIVKYDGSEEAQEAVHEMCKMAETDDIKFKGVFMKGQPNDTMAVECDHSEFGRSIYYLYSNKRNYLVFDPEKTWQFRLSIMGPKEILGEYEIDLILDEKISIKEAHPHALANNLIRYVHCMGEFRDKADLDLARFHAQGTLLTIKDLIENTEWTKKDLLKYINLNLDGLKYFVADEQIEE